MIHKTIDNTRVFQKNKFHSWEVADPRNKMIFLWRQSIINSILCRFNIFIDKYEKCYWRQARGTRNEFIMSYFAKLLKKHNLYNK